MTDTATAEPDEDDAGPRLRFTLVQAVALIVIAAALATLATWWVTTRSDDGDFNDTDIGFLTDMTTHHSGAISLAFDYLPRESDPTVAHIAREIVTGQSQEIATMNSLLAAAGSDGDAIANDDVAMEWMGEPVDPADMPGLATAADFTELEASSGLAADDVFTRLMIAHHAAGIEMANVAGVEGSDERVRRFARGIAEIQRREIGELNGRRRTLGLEEIETEVGSGGHSH